MHQATPSPAYVLETCSHPLIGFIPPTTLNQAQEKAAARLELIEAKNVKKMEEELAESARVMASIEEAKKAGTMKEKEAAKRAKAQVSTVKNLTL